VGLGKVDALLFWIAAALAVAVHGLLAVPSVAGARHGVNKFQDDAFYYLVPAKSFVREGRFTFDGRTATNGFHPLWMGATVALVAATGADAAPETHVFALNLLENVLRGAVLLACLVLGWRAGQPLRSGYLAIAVFLLYPYYVVFEQGMETTLAVLLYVLALHCVLRDWPVRLGLCLAALFLCRLDTAIFVGLPVAAWMCARGAGPLRRRMWAAIPLVAAVAVTSLANLASTGQTVPISGAIKSSFPAITWHGSYFVEPFNVVALYGWGTFRHGINLVLTGAILVAGLALATIGLSPPLRERTWVVGATGILLLANLLLFQQWEKSVDPRYYALPMTAAAFVFGAGLAGACGRVARRLGAGGYRMAALLPAALPGVVVAAMLASNLVEAAARFGPAMAMREDGTTRLYRELAAALPRDAVVAGTDVGALAFWTQRRTVNLDGVMNDFAYQARIRDRQLAAYLHEQGVTHVASGLLDAVQTYTGRPTEPMYEHMIDSVATRGGTYACHDFFVYSYVYRAYSDRICLRPADEVFRRALGPTGVGTVAFVVWKLAGDGGRDTAATNAR